MSRREEGMIQATEQLAHIPGPEQFRPTAIETTLNELIVAVSEAVEPWEEEMVPSIVEHILSHQTSISIG
jgi:hypothetical protein